MNTIPSCEAVILEIQQSLGLNDLQTAQKSRFINMENKYFTHREIAVELINKTFEPLKFEHDTNLLDDLLESAMEFFQFHSAIENGVRTFGADNRQITWLLMAHHIMPGLARKYAFWSLASPVAPGMTCGDLWFMPRPDRNDPSRLRLPVQIVADWWEDLLEIPLDSIWTDEDGERRLRTLQNWRGKEGKLPNPATIDEYFADGQSYNYRGGYQDNSKDSLEVRFKNALNFVKCRKQMDAAMLAKEIPTVPATHFEAAFSDEPDNKVKLHLVNAVTERWRVPTNSIVRRRFLLARALQVGYTRLVKLITPQVQANCPDPERNKVLQLLALFAETYRLTIEADKGCRSEAESNTRFASIVTDWLAQGPLRAIMTINGSESEELSHFLTNSFREIECGGEIENLFTGGDLSAGLATWPVSNAVLTARQEIEGQLERLTAALESGRRDESENILRQLSEHPQNQEFQPDILFCKGCHQLNANNIEEAKASFEEAFNTCRGGGYGSLRKRVAYACLGAAVAFDHFSERKERYFRAISLSLDPSEIPGYSQFDLVLPHTYDSLFRDISVKASELFWNDLYRPYTGVERLVPPSEDLIMRLITDLFSTMKSHDDEKLGLWLAENRNILESRLRDVRGDTFFGLTLKLVNTLQNNFKASVTPQSVALEIDNIIVGWREVLHRLAGEMSRKALNLTDFKKQTSLMLAADSGDVRLVDILLKKDVDFDAQDFKGRTALHGAAASREGDCFLLILRKGADPTKRTVDGLTALHTAVKFGMVDAVRETLIMWSERFDPKELNKLLEMAQGIHANYKARRPQMAQEGRKLGPKPAYKMIESIIEDTL